MAETRTGTGRPRSRGRRWVQKVAATSNAMDLPRGIFKRSPRGVAQGPKRAATRSHRTKGRTDFQSAMSMLNYHLNRGGRGLSGADRKRLEAAKRELRKVFGRAAESPGRRSA
jgi:Protein of unknown function (DUF3175)